MLIPSREVYLRKPEVFKMACLRDILNLFGQNHNPFYAGFGNRLTDALSYRSVNIPSTRIFTINSNAEISLDLLTLTKYKSSYVNMRDLVDHFFPPVSILNTDEEYTDFNYWRDSLPDPEDFTDSEDEEEKKTVPIITRSGIVQHVEARMEEEEEEEEEGEGMRESYMTGMSENYTEGEGQDEEIYDEDEGEEYSDQDEGEEYDEDGEYEEEEEEEEEQSQLEKPLGGKLKEILERPEEKPSEGNPVKQSLEQPTLESINHSTEQIHQGILEKGSKEEPLQEKNERVLTGILHNRLTGPWMKNDVNQSMVGQVVEAVEKEFSSIVEDIGERVQKASLRDGNADQESGVVPIKDLLAPVNTDEEKKERHVATQLI